MRQSELLIKTGDQKKKVIDTIVFDLDGTLLDTADDLKNSLNRVLVKRRYRPVDKERTMQCLGNGVRRLIELNVPNGSDNPEFETMVKEFKDDYVANCAVETKPYEGIINVLKELKRIGLKTAIVSNKTDYAVQELKVKYFGNLIDIAVGESEQTPRKPNPQMVYKALDMLGSSSENAVYIGDSEVDILTARNSNLDCISVSWGFRDKATLIQSGAEMILSSPEDLLNIIN
ncbi:MAG: HAD family hydrolase [Clostridiales bacterium]|nr:HAD family hydrolase [Clostridiales bacterium]